MIPLNKISVFLSAAFALLAFGGFTIVHENSAHPAPTAHAEDVLVHAPMPGEPVRLAISAIGLNAKIERIGLVEAKVLGAPKDPNDVGWFDLGPRPGMDGTAIIVGHSGWYTRESIAFDNLHRLKPGDLIIVSTASSSSSTASSSITFKVRKLASFAPTDSPSEVFDSGPGSHLNLITCAGDWNFLTQDYSQRLVVFADEE